MRASFLCGHCDLRVPDPVAYVDHVKACLEATIATWDTEAYSAAYFAQVRAMSRYRSASYPRKRSPFRAWNWWTVKPDGPALSAAEVAG